MTCGRCHSAMVLETFVDLGSGGNPGAFLGWRCVTCGAIVDPVIVQHQPRRSARSQTAPRETLARKATSLPHAGRDNRSRR